MKEINLSKFYIKYGFLLGKSIKSNISDIEEDFNNLLRDFAKEILQLASEEVLVNIKIKGDYNNTELTTKNYLGSYLEAKVNKESITNLINRIK